MKWLHYLLEVNCYIAVFYLGYLLVLRRETHYTLNRVYLLLTVLISFVAPLLQLGILRPTEKPVNLILKPVALHFTTISIPSTAGESLFSLPGGLWYGYLAGVLVAALLLLIKLSRLVQLAGTGKINLCEGYKLIHLEEEGTAFSFFGYLFIGPGTQSTQTILAHELVHIRQKHSLDIVFLELLKIVNWFNPFIYLLQRSIRTVHEYIADERAADLSADRVAYSSFLVENAYGLNGPILTNSFFNYNLLKRRIIMLNQKRSGNLARLKYLLIVPVSIGLLCVSTLAFSKDYGVIDLLPGATAFSRTGNSTIVKYVRSTQKGKLGSHGAIEIRAAKAIDTAKITADIQPERTSHVSAKGYKYTEEGYLVKGRADFRVLIVEKDGTEKEYWKSKSSPAEIKMLKNKFGYTFPSMPIYSKMPPPPPATPLINVKLLPPPPPPVPPAKGVGVIAQPSPVNPETSIKSGRTVTVAIDSDAYFRADLEDKDQTPVIVVNGSIYKLKEPLKKGQQLVVSSDTTNAVVYTDEDLKQAVAKYGPAAANGVIFAHGKTSVWVK